MERNYSLGEEIEINGKYVREYQSWWQVEIMKESVLKDRELYTNRYKVEEFSQPKKGFVVGKRSIGTVRKHFPIGYARDFVMTEIDEYENVYLVATDMRGLIYVPEQCICIRAVA